MICLSSWICHRRRCHSSLQFYNEPFIMLDVSSSWLPLLSSILQRSVCQAGCDCCCSLQFYNDPFIKLDVSSRGCHCSLQFCNDPFVSILAFELSIQQKCRHLHSKNLNGKPKIIQASNVAVVIFGDLFHISDHQLLFDLLVNI